jgi:hypothetical protein
MQLPFEIGQILRAIACLPGINLFYSIGFLLRMQAGIWLFRNCRGETPDTSTGNPMTLFFKNDVEGSNPSALTK